MPCLVLWNASSLQASRLAVFRCSGVENENTRSRCFLFSELCSLAWKDRPGPSSFVELLQRMCFQNLIGDWESLGKTRPYGVGRKADLCLNSFPAISSGRQRSSVEILSGFRYFYNFESEAASVITAVNMNISLLLVCFQLRPFPEMLAMASSLTFPLPFLPLYSKVIMGCLCPGHW